MADAIARIIVKSDTAQARADLKNLEDAARKNAENISKGFKLIGAGLVAMGTAGAMAFKSIIDTAANFQQSMSRVAAITQATDADFQSLTKRARELGQATAFTASEVAEAMKFLGMAGFDTQEILASVASTLDLAAAANVDLGRAADIASNVLTGFQLSTEESQRVVDVLAATITSANTDLEQMGDAMKYLAPTAAAFGVSIEEGAAAIGLLGNAGIQGSLSTRAFGTALTRLAKPTEQMESKLEQLDLAYRDLNDANIVHTNFFDKQTGQFVGLANMVELLENAFKGLTAEQKQGAIATIFGAEAIQEINVLMATGADGIREYTKELEDSGGVAKKMAETQLDNLRGSITLLKSAFEGLQINIGTPFLGAIRAGVDALTTFLTFINTLPEPVQKTIGVVLAFGSAITLMAGGVALLIGFKTIIVASFTAIAAAAAVAWTAITGPIGLVVAGIAAVIAVGVAIYKNWETIKDIAETVFNFIWNFIKTVFNGIQQVFSGFVSTVKEIVNAFFSFLWSAFEIGLVFLEIITFGQFSKIVLGVISLWDQIKEYFTIAWEFISNLFNNNLGAISAKSSAAWNAIKGAVGTAWEGIKGFVSAGFNFILGVIGEFTEPIIGAFSALWDGIKNVISAGIDVLVSMIKGVLNNIIVIINKVIGGLNKAITSANAIPGVNVSTISQIPALAKGGIVTRPTLALVGEAGPEAVVPLSKAGGMGTYNFNFNGPVSSKEVAMEMLNEAVQELKLSDKIV